MKKYLLPVFLSLIFQNSFAQIYKIDGDKNQDIPYMQNNTKSIPYMTKEQENKELENHLDNYFEPKELNNVIGGNDIKNEEVKIQESKNQK